MKENFIVYLWKNRLLHPGKLQTTKGERVEIIHPGQENHDAGPDFFAAKIRIDGTLWVGNVEIHTLSSNWEKHGHQHNPAYDNTILHVVFEHDRETAIPTRQMIPIMEVKNCFEKHILDNYQNLLLSKTWVPCQNNLEMVDNFIIQNWLNRLLVERLERKTGEISHFLEYFSNDWESTFYYLLARNFGFKVNASPFGLLAQHTPYNLLAKNKNQLTTIEALLFGQAGLLEKPFKDVYPRTLKDEYRYLQKKYKLQPLKKELWKFSRLRPVNFPTLRIAQFAMLVHTSGRLFRRIIQAVSPAEIIELFQIKASPYWGNHYVFDKASAGKPKNIGKDALRNIIINTIAPVMFVYGKESEKPQVSEKALSLLQEVPAENNNIIRNWKTLGVKPQNAADSQALLELKKYYCVPGKCLSCAIGHVILKNTTHAQE